MKRKEYIEATMKAQRTVPLGEVAAEVKRVLDEPCCLLAQRVLIYECPLHGIEGVRNPPEVEARAARQYLEMIHKCITPEARRLMDQENNDE